MKYFYEYKYKSRGTIRGHNLEKISVKENFIILEGHDDIPTIVEEVNDYWKLVINGEKIEYLKIEPMEEEYE